MYLSKKKLIILNILSIRPCYFKELTKLYISLGDEVYDNYTTVKEDVKFHLLTLRKNGLVRREGKRRHYVYFITVRGVQELIRHNLRELVIMM